ncbi:hypothetical protein [Candidatus Cyanaurora vandensis]|uniref:hypothetical protein n=1 Tax=Candidatus Cyanaurora vandensis TaxID=2714958 RepID=UPI00257B0348|nr:hypothetical protein [Candidatus Cyanaurora vandensis]
MKASWPAIAMHERVVRALAHDTHHSPVRVAQAGRKLLHEYIRAGLSPVPPPGGIDRWATDLWRFFQDSYRPLSPTWLSTARRLWGEIHQSGPCPTCTFFYGQAGIHCAPYPSGRPRLSCPDWQAL